MKRTCRMCLWLDQCGQDDVCEDFSPLGEDVEEFIEKERELFVAEWLEYIRDNL